MENIYFKPTKAEVVSKVLVSKKLWKTLAFAIFALSLYGNYYALKATYNFKCSAGGYFTTKAQCHQMSRPQIGLTPLEQVISLVKIPEAKADEVKTETQPNLESILNAIYRQESSSGKNDSCMAKGRFNGYGYAQSKFSWRCYETREEVRGYVSEWVQDKQAKGYTLDELLCYYNEGLRKPSCPYSIAVKSFIK